MMKNVTVIGSGTMGNGIAHTFAQFGYSVNLVDINETLLQKAMTTITKNLDRQVQKGTLTEAQKADTIKNISTYTDLSQAASHADLVVEAASEKMDIKLGIFKQLSTICPPHTILASNTSSISITQIGAATNRPERVIGMHFMNPVPVMKLVEVIRGFLTTDEVCHQIMDISKSLGKVPVEANDFPGFVANRLLIPMINESVFALQEGVSGVEEIDTVMRLGMAHPMGPLQLADFIGLDICVNILNVLHDGFGNPKYTPCPLLTKMVTAGHLGVKSGKGFYDYTGGGKNLVVAEQFRKNNYSHA